MGPSCQAYLRISGSRRKPQPRIEPADPALSRNLGLGRKARELPECVDARVGPTATSHRSMLDAHLIDRLFEHALYGPEPRLRLPAVKVRSVVTEAKAHAMRESRLVTHR